MFDEGAVADYAKRCVQLSQVRPRSATARLMLPQDDAILYISVRTLAGQVPKVLQVVQVTEPILYFSL